MTKEQWIAVKTGDRTCDGQFYYGVKTVKRVCRPSCPKRSYDPRQIVIFNTLREALEQGYVPCPRCHPDAPGWVDPKTEAVQKTEDYIRAHCAEKLTLSVLGEAMHLDKSYLARTYKKKTGRTLMDFVFLARCEKAREMLTHPEKTVSLIASATGFATASHFTQVFRRIVGCTPSEYRARYFKSLEAETKNEQENYGLSPSQSKESED